MRVISRKTLREFCAAHPEARDVHESLDAWFRDAENADWRKYADLKARYKSADVVGKYTVINIAGNKCRVILEIFYESAVVLVRHVLTHKEYDANLWRRDAFEPTAGGKKPGKRPGGERGTTKGG